MAKSKYEKDFPLRAQDYARQGLKDTQIAAKLGISEKTYYDYQLKYPQFLQAIKKGKAPVDVMVENALLKRALGFSFMETHTEYKPGEKKEGEKTEPIPVTIKRIRKFIPPDVAAAFIWLKNRRGKRWKDRHQLEIPDAIKIQIISKIPRPKDKKNNNAHRKNNL